MTAQHAILAGGRRHFQHGPIDLVIGADGDAAALEAAHAAAWARFVDVLPALVSELALLKSPVAPNACAADCPLAGPVARRMWAACHPFRAGFITPMAAVAGAVAEEIVAAYRRPGIVRAYVNNGGDIALHLAEGASLRAGLVSDPTRAPVAGLDGAFTVHASMPVRGIATSGWRGRSFSLGIADSVTVLAATAARADAAATVIANAVDVDDPRIERRPANSLKDDSDLGERLVTVAVPALGDAAVARAIEAGMARAEALRDTGLIHGVVIVCQGRGARVLREAEHTAALPFGSVFA